MDFGKAFTYMFQDPQWLGKLGIGTLLLLIGIIFSPVLVGLIPIIIVTGYTVAVVENVRLGRAHPLPEWQEWGKFAALGLKLCGAFLIWALPMFVSMIPMIAAGLLSDKNASDAVTGLAALLVVCGSCLMILWGLFLALLSPAIYARIAATERFSSAFELGKIWAFTRDNLANVVIALLLVIVAGIVASVLAPFGLVALGIGVLVTFPLAILWQYLVQSHLFGQIAAASVTGVE